MKVKKNQSNVILFLDNNLGTRRKIQSELNELNVSIITYTSSNTPNWVERILLSEKPDLVVLNLEVDYAVDLAKTTNAFKIPHVYLTSTSVKDRIRLAQKTNPLTFIRQPIIDEEFQYVFHRFLEEPIHLPVQKTKGTAGRQSTSNFRLIECTMSKSVLLNVNDLLFFKSDGVHINVTTKYMQFQTRSTIPEFIDLLSSKSVVRTHKSYGVNLLHVREIKVNTLHCDGLEIPISKMYSVQVMEQLLNLLE